MNSLIWAAGCLAQQMNIHQEKTFFIKILQILLQFTKQIRSLDDKIVVVSNLMHFISCYKMFLSKNIEFLKIVISKIFEFTKERVTPTVAEMSINTFYKIALNCKNTFILDQTKPPQQ